MSNLPLYGNPMAAADLVPADDRMPVLDASAAGDAKHKDISIKDAVEKVGDTRYRLQSTTVTWSEIDGKPSTFTPAAHTHLWAEITDKPSTFTPGAHNQAASTITDFAEQVRAQIAAMLVQGTNVTLTQSGSGATLQITVAATGGGGTPGGSSGQVQYNNAGSFGGVSGITLSTGTLQRGTFADSGLGTTTAETVVIANATAATSGATQQVSGSVVWRGAKWISGASQEVAVRALVSPTTAENDGAFLVQGRVNAGSWNNLLSLSQTDGGLVKVGWGSWGLWGNYLSSLGWGTSRYAHGFSFNGSGQVIAASTGFFGFNSGSSFDGSTGGGVDTRIRRRSAANLQLGGEDAAAPVAQTLSVQNVVAGTSNTAGVTWTFQGSRGTGTGAGGEFVFQVATAGSSGTSQNSLVEAFRIRQDRALFVGNVSAEPATPSGGGVLYVESGALKYKGSSGTVTTIANA